MDKRWNIVVLVALHMTLVMSGVSSEHLSSYIDQPMLYPLIFTGESDSWN